MPNSLVSGVEIVVILNEDLGVWRRGKGRGACLLSSDSAKSIMSGNTAI